MKNLFAVLLAVTIIGLVGYSGLQADLTNGPASSSSVLRMPVAASTVASASTAEIVPGTLVTLAGGYVRSCTNGDNTIFGVALSTATPGATSGDVEVLVDFGNETIHRLPANATPTISMVGGLYDCASALCIDVGSSTDDLVQVVKIDAVNNYVYFRLNQDEQIGF